MRAHSIRLVLWAAVAALTAATTASFLGSWSWLFDLFSHFRLQYVGLLALLLAAALVLRHRWVAVVAAVVLLPNLLALGYYFPSRSDRGIDPDLRVISFNVLASNREPDAALEYLRDSGADVLALFETNRSWFRRMDSLAAEFPHAVKHSGGMGIAVYSRHPIRASRCHDFDNPGSPCLEVEIACRGRTIRLLATHPYPPVGTGAAQLRDHHLSEVARLAASAEGPVIVAGDFNATPWSHIFRRFVATTGLSDSGRGRGFQSTWQRRHPLFSIPIDHILHSHHLLCTGRDIGPAIGSDHRPVVAEFRFREEGALEAEAAGSAGPPAALVSPAGLSAKVW